eukprot:Skav226204  [mRNA]  locus=scaffold2208:481631:482173:- [translate_table: standard]
MAVPAAGSAAACPASCPQEGHGDAVKSVDFSTCGQMAATASADGTARVWVPEPSGVRSGVSLQFGMPGQRRW